MRDFYRLLRKYRKSMTYYMAAAPILIVLDRLILDRSILTAILLAIQVTICITHAVGLHKQWYLEDE